MIFFLVISLLIPNNYSTKPQVEKILDQVEQGIRNTKLLSYSVLSSSINPRMDNSTSKTTGTVWLKRVPGDTFFGAYFHVQGTDSHGKFDYYYDGQNGIEIRHKTKNITIFHPDDYPDTPNHPAKARMALRPFNQLLINSRFKNTLLKENPRTSLRQNADRTKWMVTLDYPRNKYGQEATTILDINKANGQIDRIRHVLEWRGLTYKNQIIIGNYQINDPQITDYISLTADYRGYKREVFKRKSKKITYPYKEVVGKPAPKFTYESFSGKNISLDQFKGKMVLLDFWESWCGYCILSLPKLNQLQREWKDKLVVLGIVTQNQQAIKKLIKSHGVIYQNIWADQKILSDYKVSPRPVYILIGTNGNVVSVSIGDLEKIKAKLKELLK